MTAKPTQPVYLPAVNSRLEYQAGLLSTTTDRGVAIVQSRPRLGADFTHIIVTR